MRATLSLVVLASCLDTTLPPLGEARITVHTDLPVPRLANRLRIDLYTVPLQRADGARWFASRDVARLEPSNWPVSFGVRSDDPTRGGAVLVRLRAYVAGVTRDYHGERFAPRPAPEPAGEQVVVAAPADEAPRLVQGGRDVTPRTEPEPSAAVDRLVLVRIQPGSIEDVSVTLRGACAGSMADLAGARTCVSEWGELRPADAITREPPAKAGEFGASEGCASEPRAGSINKLGAPLFDEEVCVPGGAFLFGSRSDIGDIGPLSARPERVVVEPPFFVDKYEMTVGRYRQALLTGFRWGGVGVNDDPLEPEAETQRACTFSTTTKSRDRLPLTCVRVETARALCKYFGGDLLSETQYELAASRGLERTRYPWGEELPSCGDAIFARQTSTIATGVCQDVGVGPAPEDDPASDVAASGVVNLAGNVKEMVLDEPLGLSTRCWTSLAPLAPRCATKPRRKVGARGGSWKTTIDGLRVEFRTENEDTESVISSWGFRCARSAR